MRFPWSVDPTRCARCGHLESLHRSRVLYPRSPDRRLARPCTRPDDRPWLAFPGHRPYDGCGCPDFVTPAPVRLRVLNWLLDHWRVVIAYSVALTIVGAVGLIILMSVIS